MVLSAIKGRGIAPDTWQRSAPVPLDKGTTKPGPARFRLLHLLCPFGKAFYGDLWRNTCPRKVNTDAHSKGRRRVAATLIQHVVRWRLTRGDVLAQIGTTMTGVRRFQRIYERPPHNVGASFEDEMDRALMKQRAEIVPSCGFLQGNVAGPSLFNDVYSEQIAKWERHCEKTDTDAEDLHAMCFYTGDTYDASSIIFVDDITKRTVTNTPQEVVTKNGRNVHNVKKVAADIGIVVNQSEEEHQVGFVRPGSVTSMRTLHREGIWPDSIEKLCPTQRVLGTLLTYNCSNVAERQARLRAAQAGSTVMGRFLECGVFTASQTNYFPQQRSGRHS